MGEMKTYNQFLAEKSILPKFDGIKPKPINEKLFRFQEDIVRWALQRGRAAIFADCGLGKTFMQLEWAKQISGCVLIFCPLAVADQTKREGEKLKIKVNRAYQQSDCIVGIELKESYWTLACKNLKAVEAESKELKLI